MMMMMMYNCIYSSDDASRGTPQSLGNLSHNAGVAIPCRLLVKVGM